MFEESFIGPPPLTTTARITLTVWVAILVPWVPFFTLIGTGMAFKGGYTIGAYLAVFQFWAYPILVGVSYYFRRRKPVLVWLPALVLVPALI